MSIFTARGNGLLLLILVVLLGWYLLGVRLPADTQVASEHRELSATENNLRTAPVAGNKSAPVVNTKPAEQKVVNPTTKAEQIYEDIQIPVETEELISWRLERGYPDDTNSYDSYDETTLTTLADSGDIRAIQKLAERYTNRGNLSDADKATISDLYRRAALYGSTFAFLYLGVQQESAYTSLSADDPRRRETAIEILATYNVAALRGDRMPNIARGNHFVSQNNIELTEEDWQSIESRSREIYNNLCKHRYALSLDEFDNDVPESVVQYFSEVEAVQEKVNQHRQAQ